MLSTTNSTTLPLGGATPVELWTLGLVIISAVTGLLILLFGEGFLLRFFVSPKLDIRIQPRGEPAPEITSPIMRCAWNDIGLSPDEVVSQSLMVRAKRNSIERLEAMIWLNGTAPRYMCWRMTESTVSAGKRIKLVESLRYTQLLKDGQIPLLVWFAYRRNDRKEERLTVNVDPPFTQNLNELKESVIDIDIQFVPIDKKPRKYQLNAKSWDELNLTKRN